MGLYSLHSLLQGDSLLVSFSQYLIKKERENIFSIFRTSYAKHVTQYKVSNLFPDSFLEKDKYIFAILAPLKNNVLFANHLSIVHAKKLVEKTKQKRKSAVSNYETSVCTS